MTSEAIRGCWDGSRVSHLSRTENLRYPRLQDNKQAGKVTDWNMDIVDVYVWRAGKERFAAATAVHLARGPLDPRLAGETDGHAEIGDAADAAYDHTRPDPMAFNEVRLLLNKGIMGRHFKNHSYIYFLFPVQVELKTISATKVNSATPAPIPRITNIP